MTFTVPALLVGRLRGGRLGRLVRLTVRQSINGRTVLVPLVGGLGFDNLSPFEPWLDETIGRLLSRQAGAFVDVGVNVGQTLLKVKTRVPGAAYIGFEPNPACFAYAQRLIHANRFTDCTLVPAGLYHSPAILPLHLRTAGDPGGSIIEGFRRPSHYHHTQHVVVLPGDLMLQNLGAPPVALIKIDVEGAELEVVEGLHDTLDSRPFVLCEILPLFGETNPKALFRQPRQARLLALMRGRDYALYRMLGDGRVVPLEDIAAHGDMSLTNYLFAPREECSFIEAAFSIARASGAQV
jgi:FkbM family methyltransferase